MYKKDLEKELRGETSGDFAKLVVALLHVIISPIPCQIIITVAGSSFHLTLIHSFFLLLLVYRKNMLLVPFRRIWRYFIHYVPFSCNNVEAEVKQLQGYFTPDAINVAGLLSKLLSNPLGPLQITKMLLFHFIFPVML